MLSNQIHAKFTTWLHVFFNGFFKLIMQVRKRLNRQTIQLPHWMFKQLNKATQNIHRQKLCRLYSHQAFICVPGWVNLGTIAKSIEFPHRYPCCELLVFANYSSNQQRNIFPRWSKINKCKCTNLYNYL